MQIKKIITTGCSVSSGVLDTDPCTWPNQLAKYVTALDSSVVVKNLSIPSQGQELIQKKASLELIESLREYQPSEIAVIAMWSGLERRSLYVENRSVIQNLIVHWVENNFWWDSQFLDLKNHADSPRQEVLQLPGITGQLHNAPALFNQSPGWYIFSAARDDGPVSKAILNLTDTAANLHANLESMIFLQNLCKVKGVKFYQQFMVTAILADIEKMNHQIVNYLAEQIDFSTVISRTGIVDYFDNNWDYFVEPGNYHPNTKGHEIWFNSVMLPFLTNQGFFNE